MQQSTLRVLITVLFTIALAACESTITDSDSPGNAGLTTGSASDAPQTVSIDGVSLMNDPFVWNTFIQEEDSEPVNIDRTELVKSD